jgi:putative nucleotidyltransferase with HDIG domain
MSMTTMSHLQIARAAEQDGMWDDAIEAYQAALRDARAGGDSSSEGPLLRTLGRVWAERGEYDRARDAFEECLVIAQARGQQALAASALNCMAGVAQLRGQLDVAERLYGRAGDLAEQINDGRLSAMIEQNLGTIANIRGDLPSALLRYRAALEQFRELGDDRASAWVLNNMGMLHVDVGEYTAAELSFNAAYQISERQNDVVNLAKIDTNRAELFLRRQNYERSREYCDRAFRTFTRIASHSGLADVHRFYGVLYRETGKPQVAHMQLALALRLARTADNKLSEAETESERARVFLAERHFRPALVSLNRAHELFSELDARSEILDLQRRLERLEEPYLQALQLWTEHEPLLQAERTAKRGARVGDIAGRMVRALGHEAHVTTVRLGSFLHDIGTAAVPREVIAKPGPLTPSERAIVQQHAVMGEEIVRDLHFSTEVVTIVRNHHEHWDGTGYPDRLQGEQIPLLARVVCIADVFDALTSHRSFRPALPPQQAIALMETESGKTFDPNLFQLFRNLVGGFETDLDLSAQTVFA